MANNQNKMNAFNKPICTCCFKTFNNDEDLTSHIKYHTHFKPYWCPNCHKTHPRNKPYERDICHRMNHKDKTLFNCELCTYNTKSKKYLKAHQLVHTNQPDYIFLNDINFDTISNKEQKILKDMYIQCSDL